MNLERIVLYHGTPQKLHLDDLEYNISSKGRGIYFTDQLEWAEIFGFGGRVIKVAGNNLNVLVDNTCKYYNRKEINLVNDTLKKTSFNNFDDGEFDVLRNLNYDGKVYFLDGGLEFVIMNKNKLRQLGIIET